MRAGTPVVGVVLGKPSGYTSNDFPPSRVRLTTSRPSTGMRVPSLTAGTNQAVFGSRGWTATPKPNPDGGTPGTCAQVRPASAERKTPLWCWIHMCAPAM
ncbi:MAG: hypothetical protein U0797_21135 [Gemmataceae bacterium]